MLAFCLPVGTPLFTGLVCWGAAMLHPLLGLAVQMFWCGQALAAKGLVQESTKVYAELKRRLTRRPEAVEPHRGPRHEALTAEGVTKAAVETVAENASDGVIAPLLYMLLGGAPLALTYKAINTMDSMLGYKNENISTLAVPPQNWTMWRTISRAVWRRCSGSWRRRSPAMTPRARGVSGGGTAAITPAPTAPRLRAPARVRWASSWPGRPTISGSITRSPPSATRCGPSSRRIFCGQIG